MSAFGSSLRAHLARLSTVAVVAALAATGLVSGTATSAQAADRGLRLISTDDEIEAYSEGDGYVYFEPSVWLAAYGQGYEFWAKRDQYADPVSLTKTVIRGSRRITTRVPAQLVDGFLGFKNGLTTTITGMRGKVLSTETQNLCPGGWDNQRVDPTGPSEPMYPSYCWGSWFTKATVFGVEQGWAVRANSYGYLETTRKQFNVTVSISDPVADYLDIPAASRTVTQHVTVLDGGGCGIAAGCRTLPTERQVRATTDVPKTMAATSSSTRKALPTVAAARPARDTLPDLVSLPAWGINAEADGDGVDRLNFNANEWNAGPAPMVVEGYRQGTKPIMDAYQVFYRDGEAVSTKQTGTMEFHDEAEHNHWHFLDFAKYDLVTQAGAFVTTSGKQSWCLAPTDPVDLSLPNAVWRPESTGLSSSCGDESALWLRETMPVGWGDTYGQYQTQAFDLTGVKNGTYQIKITVNPNGNLFESTRSNNVSLRTVKIGGRPGHRTVTVPPYQGVDTETGGF
ncbi:putative secreted protein [metagenome]|uniref:Putative secreted protein n=1 Tax=metagenome TaxID=256318 RepID=A0A2P2C1D6_9ZZZZ